MTLGAPKKKKQYYGISDIPAFPVISSSTEEKISFKSV